MHITNLNPIEIAQILSSLFFSILFFQSGIDKIIDFKGNLIFFTEHFKNTLLKNILSPSLYFLIIIEIVTAIINSYGFIYSIFYLDTFFIFSGAVFSSIVFLILFFGQRIAKDYIGAADITIYFILSIITLISFELKG